MKLKGVKKTILVADGEKEVRDLIHIALYNPRYRILETADGNAALDLARREKPDLLVLDRTMPHMGGIEIARVLQRDLSTANIPIIMLTAIDEKKDKQQAHDIDIFAYIPKPFDPMELRKKVEAVLT